MPDSYEVRVSYSQNGEDLFLRNVFNLIGITHPSYLDLGAHHPFRISNTALFYAGGSRGVNVEANPNLIGAFRKHRPRDRNLNFGVGPVAGNFDFFMIDPWSGRNSFDPKEVIANTTKHNLPPKEKVQIRVKTINDIVRYHCRGSYPDLLLTDLEGMDYAVLKSADFTASRPKVICTEARKEDALNVWSLLQSRGFRLYCRIQENLIFVESAYTTRLY